MTTATKIDLTFLNTSSEKYWNSKEMDYPFRAVGPGGVVPDDDFKAGRYGDVLGVVLSDNHRRSRLWGFQTAEFRDKFVAEIKGAKAI